MNIGVIGASGYSGGELLRILAGHPDFKVSYIAAGSSAGVSITKLHPHLSAYAGLTFESTEISRMNECDLLFLALPHGESAKIASEIREDIRIVDLGADFRLESSESWAKYYGGVHAGTWTYGMPELPGQREKIALATRVANPGCYATAIALALDPAVRGEAIDSSDIVIVAASGTTGAGRSAKVDLLGSEVMNSLSSYKFGGVHQHTPEIEENLSRGTSEQVKISFTPILAPMPRGILATITAKVKPGFDYAQLREIYEEAYSKERFVRLLPEGELPKTSALLGSNSLHLQIALDPHTDRLIISAAIDNLGKGASAQAIQNANIMHGFAEDRALEAMGYSS